MERYAAAVLPYDQLVHACPGSLKGEIVDLPDLLGFADHQYSITGFPFARPDNGERLAWVRAEDAAGRRQSATCWVPAQLVYLEAFSSLDERLLDLRLSVGLAAGSTVHNATAAGLCEVIERHVACTWWHAQEPVPRLDPALAGANYARLAEGWADRGVVAIALRLPCRWPIGVVAVALVDRSGRGPYATFGLAAGFDWSQLAIKALLESMMIRQSCRRLMALGPDCGSAIDPSEVIRLRDHVLFYADDRSGVFLDPLFAAVDDVQTPPIDRELTDVAGVLRSLAAEGFRALRVVITPDELRAAGYEVVRVMVPGLRPMDVIHNAPHIRNTGSLGPYPAAPHPFG